MFSPYFKKASLCMIWGAIIGKENSSMVLWNESWDNITTKAYGKHIIPKVYEFW